MYYSSWRSFSKTAHCCACTNELMNHNKLWIYDQMNEQTHHSIQFMIINLIHVTMSCWILLASRILVTDSTTSWRSQRKSLPPGACWQHQQVQGLWNPAPSTHTAASQSTCQKAGGLTGGWLYCSYCLPKNTQHAQCTEVKVSSSSSLVRLLLKGLSTWILTLALFFLFNEN